MLSWWQPEYRARICGGVGWKVPALWATAAVIGLAVAGAAVGLAVHGTAGALWGVVPGALAGVVAGFVPAFRDRAREERERAAAAWRAWQEAGEPAAGDRGLSPAGLLRPERAVVEFTGRDAELGELLAWCSSDVRRSVRVLVGAGGTGKTRLALQVASEWQAAGHAWRLVGAGAEGIVLQAARGVTAGPVLLVVDYAETRENLVGLLRAVLEDPGPVRVLLMARSLGEWWDKLAEQSSYAVARMLAAAALLQLDKPVSEAEPDARLAAAAVPYFARALGVPVPGTVVFELLDRRVPVLVLHAAALVAVLRSAEDPARRQRVAVGRALDELLEHEARYWRRTAAAARLSDDGRVLKPVVAAAALLGAADLDDAAAVAGRVPDLAGAGPGELRRWGRWLYGLYPAGADGRLGSLQPDLLAEATWPGNSAADPGLARACLHELTQAQAEQALTVLARAWAHHPDARRSSRRRCMGPGPAGGPGGRGRGADPRRTGRPAGRRPCRTPRVVGGADRDRGGAPLSQRGPRAGQPGGDPRILRALPPAPSPATVARWADRTGLMLAGAGPPGRGAARRRRKRCAIYRELAAASPTATAPTSPVPGQPRHPVLGAGPPGRRAAAHRGSRRHLPGAGRRQPRPVPPRPRPLAEQPRHPVLASWAARPTRCRSTEEAVAIRRELAAASPDRYRPDLATSLSNLGVRFSELGRPADALPVAEEAVAHLPGAGRRQPGPVPPRPRRLAGQPRHPVLGAGPPGRGAAAHRGGGRASAGSWPPPTPTGTAPTSPPR